MSDIKEESQSSVDVLNDNIKRDIDQTIEISQSTLSKDSILTTETDKIAESEITEKTDAPENKESKDKNENVNSSDISSVEDKNNSPVDSLKETEPLERMHQKLSNNGDSLIDQDKNIDQLENNNLINTEPVGESIASAVSQDDTGKSSQQLAEKEDASGEQMDIDHEKEEPRKDDQSEQEMETHGNEEDSKETAKGKDDDMYQSLRAEEIISITDEQPNELDEYKLRATEGRAAAEEGENDNSELVSSEGLVVGSFKMPQNILEGVEDTELVQAIRCAALSPLPDATPADVDSEITEILDKTNSPKQARVRTNSTKSSQSAQDNRIGSLGLLAMNYDSDMSENEERENDNATDQQEKDQYRSIPLVSDSSSSSSDSDVEIVNEPPKIIDLDMLDDDEDEENPKKPRGPLRAKGEMLLEDLPPIQDLQITVPEYECVELGKVHSIVDQLVLVDSIPGTVPLNLDTVLFLEKGKKVLGEVFDVLGQVSNPLYCVRFNSNDHIKEKCIELGQTVYVAPRSEHTQFVILPELMQTRGSDASWQHDIEPSEKHLDYSDDEEERKAKISHRNKNRSNEEPEIVKKQRVTPGANRHSRSQYRDQGDQGNYYHPSPQYAQPPQQRSPFPNPSQQYPQFNQYPENQYHYNDAGSSWHANYANNQYVPNPFSRPQFISPNAMHKAVFPTPPPPPPPHNQ